MAAFVQTDGKSWRLDATRWPVIIVQRLSDSIEDAALVTALEVSARMIDERGGRYSLVLDNRLARGMSATQRKLIAADMAKHAERTKRLCLGTAFVFDSALMRGILTAVFWLREPEVETRVFADIEEAVSWAGVLHVNTRVGTGT